MVFHIENSLHRDRTIASDANNFICSAPHTLSLPPSSISAVSFLPRAGFEHQDTRFRGVKMSTSELAPNHHFLKQYFNKLGLKYVVHLI